MKLRWNEISTLIFFIIVFLIYLIFIFLGINSLLLLSFNSYLSDCNFVEIQPGVTTLGTTSLVSDTVGNINIKVRIYINESQNSVLYKRVMIHEQCHVNQYNENRWYSCNNPIKVFENELECYIESEFLFNPSKS